MISDYNIIVAGSIDKLIKAVKEEISKGWQPYGDYHIDAQCCRCSQMVVKFDGKGENV